MQEPFAVKRITKCRTVDEAKSHIAAPGQSRTVIAILQARIHDSEPFTRPFTWRLSRPKPRLNPRRSTNP